MKSTQLKETLKRSLMRSLMPTLILTFVMISCDVDEESEDGVISNLGSLKGLEAYDLDITLHSASEGCVDFFDVFTAFAERCDIDASSIRRFMLSYFPGSSCDSIVELRDVRGLYKGCIPQVEGASCEEFASGIDDEGCDAQFIYDPSFENNTGVCEDVVKAFSARVSLCGGDYDSTYSEYRRTLKCDELVDIRDRDELYERCISAILSSPCDQLGEGFNDQGCAGQLLFPAEE